MLAKVTNNLYLKRRDMLGGPIYKKVTRGSISRITSPETLEPDAYAFDEAVTHITTVQRFAPVQWSAATAIKRKVYQDGYNV